MYNSDVKNISCIAALLLAAAAPLLPQTVQKLDPAVDRLVSPKAVLKRAATGFDKWTEGPVWTRANTLLFAVIPANSIMQWQPGKPATVFMHPSGYTGSAPYGGPEPGSNGKTIDAQGRLTVAGHARRNVWRLEKIDPSATITVLADTYQGKRLNSPNDLVYRSDGSLYLLTLRTDSPHKGQGSGKQLQVNGVYRIPGALGSEAGRTALPRAITAIYHGPDTAQRNCLFAG